MCRYDGYNPFTTRLRLLDHVLTSVGGYTFPEPIIDCLKKAPSSILRDKTGFPPQKPLILSGYFAATLNSAPDADGYLLESDSFQIGDMLLLLAHPSMHQGDH